MRGLDQFFLELGEQLADVLRHQVRYQMHWGHKVISKEGPADATRAEYNAAFGVDSPEQPEIPEAAAHIWEWWWQLNARRSPGFDSTPPLSYFEIYCWSSLTRTQITPSEIGILTVMDDAYLHAINTERKEQRDRNKT